jgi:hypothetical protein
MGLAQQYVCDYAAQIHRSCDGSVFRVDSARGGTAVTVRVRIDVGLLVLPGANRAIEGRATACTEIGLNDPIVGCG